MKQTLEEKQAEKARLSKAYKARKRQQWADLLRSEPRLRDFRRKVRAIQSPAALLVALADSWVRNAPTETRYAALRIIDKQLTRIARFNGGQELDDPLPPKRSPFHTAKEMLAVR
jgi:hypothetical protein